MGTIDTLNVMLPRSLFSETDLALFVPAFVLREAVAELATHDAQRRPLERDHVLAVRHLASLTIPPTRCNNPEQITLPYGYPRTGL